MGLSRIFKPEYLDQQKLAWQRQQKQSDTHIFFIKNIVIAEQYCTI